MSYWQSMEPGAGRRAPRADALSNARRMSLNGTWRFRLCPTAMGTGADFTDPSFDDADWDEIHVPGHWVLQEVTPPGQLAPRSLRGTADGPLYTNTALPIPIDPPRVPAENPTGDHRLVFTAPQDWHGKAVLRFQGVDSCAKVWFNGVELGWSTGSRLPAEYDVELRPGRNVLAVRVHRWSAGTYLEDQDMWWLPGIFRDVELLERPPNGIEDHQIHASYDHRSGTGTLRVDTDVPARVEIPELGIVVPAGQEITLPVEPWSAEHPRLYRGTLVGESEIVDLAVGFRTVTVENGALLVNGRRVFLRGVNRHEHDPETGRALSHETMLRDVLLMKQHNINAVRTSHYPPHPEFLRLCDEFGLWVVEECDIETHGFIYTGWAGNPPAQPMWRDALLDRIQRMVERDKNRPSVIVWSMANESWTGENFDELEQWIRERDPSRPLMYERDPSYRNSDFYSIMYPSLETLEAIGRREEERPAGVSDAEDDRRRTLPFLLCEYAHAMGNGPGSLADYHRIMRSSERFCGGFVWEWIDHGFHHRDGEGQAFVMHGSDVAHRPNGGRFCLDGLLFADRTPSPGLRELAAVLSPVVIDVGRATATLHNEHDTLGLEHLELAWRVETEGEESASGVLDIPACAAGETVSLDLPVPAAPLEGETWITAEARLRREESWAPRGHVIARGQGLLEPAGAPPEPASAGIEVTLLAPRPGGGHLTLGPGRFDPLTGALVELGELPTVGPEVDLYRAPTENDRGQGGHNDLASVWSAVGLDRMQHRTDAVEITSHSLQVLGRSAPAAHGHGVAYHFEWSAPDERSLELEVTLDFTGPWTDTPFRQRDILVPRIGLRMALPRELDHVEWFGLGPGESYADSRHGAYVGRFGAPVDALQTNYPVPQENGNRQEVRWLRLTGSDRSLGVTGSRFSFAARRWTAQDLERARHPHDLRDSGKVWLTLDHAQQGLGSASCGPALPEQYRLDRSPTTWRVVFTV
ncbi:glycoside hydrolase family 2 TIM barrel-domain containing protein [Bogoriella caseilytica]|uniref:Beta-galactosidase n=1 Tax=Bogoriella caseilytica TaxID=56055 RepID=A0A3N2BAV9_9MICO|nr:glycoside hydrolase family 2 TIM barrel-domain containing protein [Bogoriella caseilytica]ROR72410.1 beta-galactosidase [Bogoriella caseilytica]